MSEVEGFPPDIAEIAREVLLICMTRAFTPSIAATHQAAEWVNLEDGEGSPILGVSLELSSFRKRISEWIRDREKPLAWWRRLDTRDGYVLLRRLQGATHRAIADELDVSHTAVIKAWRRYVASGDVPPLIDIPFVERRPRQADRKKRAEIALMVWAWYSASPEMITLSEDRFGASLTGLIRGAPRVMAYYAQGIPRCLLDFTPLLDDPPEVPRLSDAELQALAEEHEQEDVEMVYDGDRERMTGKLPQMSQNILKGAQQSLHDYYSA